ncbi:MAG TPA: polyphosphate kinase 1, partial [Candidatus Krumholzibacteria bacterium]|nr:polyphosphate kinase 1 [Candidatus Krumholzibacteria bacterium]
INREISWLSFNDRVLQEASDPSVPLVERLKFIGIFSSNLEEFFRVRVATLQRMVDAGIDSNKMVYGGSPKKVLKQIHEVVVEQRGRFDRVFAEVRAALEKENVFLIDERQLLPEHREFVQGYFEDSVRPTLVPVILDTLPEFPYLKNGVIYLAVRLESKQNGAKPRHALIEVSTDTLPRFLVLPGTGEKRYVIMLDDVIRFGLKEVFSIFDVDRADAYTIKLTRDAEIEIDDDVTMSLMDKISKSLKKRKEGPPVRFVYDRELPKDLLDLIMKKANLRKLDNVIAGGRYHNARDFVSFPKVTGSSLQYEPQPPLHHPALATTRSVFSVMRKQDVLLHLPYQSFHHVTDLLREAAIDPKVKSISMTLYRVARDSHVVNALINAVRNGKKVTVLFELQARFDEEANIRWTRKLEDEGARLIGGVPGLKVHAKLALITRKEEGKLVDYALVGTGNFNEVTARVYADHILMTSDERVTVELRKLFDFLETNYRTHQYHGLMVSPFDMRRVLHKLVRREIKNARAGKPAYIDVKLNSLVDRELIYLLYEASRAGVKVRLIVRGTCSLVPGLPGVSENIEAVSIVDRYLEHSRIFFFANGGNERCYLSSGDWMTRNLDFRVEIAVPVYDDAVRAELRYYFNLQLRDTAKARIINQAQDNPYRRGSRNHRAQIDIYRWLARASGHRGSDA